MLNILIKWQRAKYLQFREYLMEFIQVLQYQNQFKLKEGKF